MEITEPATLITNWVLSLEALAFVVASRRSPVRLWPIGFATLAAAAAVGGAYHGFTREFSESTHNALLTVVVFLLGGGGAFVISAALTQRVNPDARRWQFGAMLSCVAGFGVWLAGISLHPDFNHNDLSHCVQMVTLYLLFRSAQPPP